MTAYPMLTRYWRGRLPHSSDGVRTQLRPYASRPAPRNYLVGVSEPELLRCAWARAADRRVIGDGRETGYGVKNFERTLSVKVTRAQRVQHPRRLASEGLICVAGQLRLRRRYLGFAAATGSARVRGSPARLSAWRGLICRVRTRRFAIRVPLSDSLRTNARTSDSGRSVLGWDARAIRAAIGRAVQDG